ncbi:ferritin family protein [Candidatus Methanoplasma termitum]|nr:ferritin family protein [Candidatus Methanoplasma termitum]
MKILALLLITAMAVGLFVGLVHTTDSEGANTINITTQSDWGSGSIMLNDGDKLIINPDAGNPIYNDEIINVIGNASIDGGGGTYDNLHIMVQPSVQLVLENYNLDYNYTAPAIALSDNSSLVVNGSCNITSYMASSVISAGSSNIVLSGVMIINSNNGCISSTGNLTISGSGALISVAGSGSCIQAATLSVDGATVSAKSYSGNGLLVGASSDTAVKNGATLNLTGGEAFSNSAGTSYGFIMDVGTTVGINNNYGYDETHQLKMASSAVGSSKWVLSGASWAMPALDTGQTASDPSVDVLFTYGFAGMVKLVPSGGTPICRIGTAMYYSLDAAIAAVPADQSGTSPTTITLLTDITYAGECQILEKTITFDLNGHNLIFSNLCGTALYVDYNSAVDYVDASNMGTFQTFGGLPSYMSGGMDVYAGGLDVMRGRCSLTYAETTDGIAAYAEDGGHITVNGNVVATGNGIGASAIGYADVTVEGTITAPVYVVVNQKEFAFGDGVQDPYYPGYLTYENIGGYVWVKATTGAAPTITTTTLPDGKVGVSYSYTITATGDVPITWNVSAGSLPAGLNIDAATGAITGTPNGTPGTANFTIKASNGVLPDATMSLSITVAAAFVPVTNITGIPTTATAGTPLTLVGTVAPPNATNQSIIWSISSAGTTGATITGSTLNATAAGTVIVTATVVNGQTSTTDYTQNFYVDVVLSPIAQTYEDLYVAMQGELNANAHFTAFAAKAKDESYPMVARIFQAMADAEAKQAEDAWVILQSMGATVKPVAATPTVGTTAENLQASIDGATYEYTVMYPGFQTNAQAAGLTAAADFFKFAGKAAQTYATITTDALQNLSDWSYMESNFNAVYRCPTCGEVVKARPTTCPICGTAGTDFVLYSQTYDDLYVAMQGELNANAHFTAFAAKAKDESYPMVARIFQAMADAEAKQAEDAWVILQSMGATVKPVAATPTVGTTAENLQASIDGATYEYTVMYPGFQTNAQAAGLTAAADFFKFAGKAAQTYATITTDCVAKPERLVLYGVQFQRGIPLSDMRGGCKGPSDNMPDLRNGRHGLRAIYRNNTRRHL